MTENRGTTTDGGYRPTDDARGRASELSEERDVDCSTVVGGSEDCYKPDSVVSSGRPV